MAKNVSLLGADYPDVPAVVLPQTGGGSATFTDVSDTTATPSDVLSGKDFFSANGVLQQGGLITHNVYDGLDSNSSVDALSAKQGKVLNDKIIEVKKITIDAQTDGDGDVNLNLNINVPLLSAVPDRNAGSGYYTSWYTVLLNGKRAGYSYYSCKIVNDSLQNVANQRVKFTIYYLIVPYIITE